MHGHVGAFGYVGHPGPGRAGTLHAPAASTTAMGAPGTFASASPLASFSSKVLHLLSRLRASAPVSVRPVQRELGLRWKAVGAFQSAVEIFEHLQMWEDVIECYRGLQQERKVGSWRRSFVECTESVGADCEGWPAALPGDRGDPTAARRGAHTRARVPARRPMRRCGRLPVGMDAVARAVPACPACARRAPHSTARGQ